MPRNYVPDCKKDEAYYIKRFNNAASVKSFREKKKKAEEEHNKKILNLRQKIKELSESIHILTKYYQLTVNNLNYNYVTNLNNIYITYNHEIIRQVEILDKIIHDIPQIKTRQYGLKKIVKEINCNIGINKNNPSDSNTNYNKITCENKHLK